MEYREREEDVDMDDTNRKRISAGALHGNLPIPPVASAEGLELAIVASASAGVSPLPIRDLKRSRLNGEDK